MAMRASEIKDWIDSLPANALVGIDDGGLALLVIADEVNHLDDGAYLEVGGIPKDLES
jgi:hypothetical protein